MKLLIELTDSPIDTGAALEAVRHEEAGGTSVFLGTTRRYTEGRETSELRYEAHAGLAKAEMERLVQSANKRYDLLAAAVIHRTGNVPVGEASVVIAVATRHRDAAFKACRFLIDELKKTVPVWKKEVYTDGTEEWVRPLGKATDG